MTKKPNMKLGWGACVNGSPRPASPKPVFAEDNSLLIRHPRRLKLNGPKPIVLH